MNVLVTGITGFVGSRLAPRLEREGHTLRGFSRRPPDTDSGVPIVVGDAVSGEGLAEAMSDIDVAYFLMHSMEPVADVTSPDGDAGAFGERERAAAENFAREARAAGVNRVIYLGGLVPAGGPRSAHLTSRLAVEEILLSSAPCAVAFRASIVIGAGSRSFRFLVRLVERLPVLAVPAWRTHVTTPIDERDVTEILARAATSDEVCSQSLDLGGPDVVTYGELIDRISELLLVTRPTISFKRLTLTPIASRVSAVIAGERHELIGPLMESLDQDLLPRDNRAVELLDVRLHSLDAAIEHALAEWEATERLAAR
ncbi:MAG: NAD-dependent epimerase/dehydratase family protein [Solirubrobacterales bacterium]|nr:NAD-dependent epimerase/dehydratase family protein [Solirubrobacterales bacterium]